MVCLMCAVERWGIECMSMREGERERKEQKCESGTLITAAPPPAHQLAPACRLSAGVPAAQKCEACTAPKCSPCQSRRPVRVSVVRWFVVLMFLLACLFASFQESVCLGAQ